MRLLPLAYAALLLTSCAPVGRLQAEGASLKPSQVLSDAQSFEGKHISVVGYLHVTPEWWTSTITETSDRRSDDGRQCLNLGGVEFLLKNKDFLNGKRVVLPGVFHADGFKGSLYGCETAAGLMTRSAEVQQFVCVQFSALPGCKS